MPQDAESSPLRVGSYPFNPKSSSTMKVAPFNEELARTLAIQSAGENVSWKSPAVRDAFAVGFGMGVEVERGAERGAESDADFGGAAGADVAS